MLAMETVVGTRSQVLFRSLRRRGQAAQPHLITSALAFTALSHSARCSSGARALRCHSGSNQQYLPLHRRPIEQLPERRGALGPPATLRLFVATNGSGS